MNIRLTAISKVSLVSWSRSTIQLSANSKSFLDSFLKDLFSYAWFLKLLNLSKRFIFLIITRLLIIIEKKVPIKNATLAVILTRDNKYGV